MPHLTLEYTNNLENTENFDPLFIELHRILADVGQINIGNCKSRARNLDHWLVAEGGKGHAVVHLDIAFLAGRTEQVKNDIGRQSLAALQNWFAARARNLNVQITVEVRDIERSNYHKYPEGTFTGEGYQ